MADYFEGSYGGSNEMLDNVKEYVKDYSMIVFGLLIVAVLYILYIHFWKKENMYNPGATAWFQLGNWKENMIDPAQLNCADVSMTGYDSEDPYRTYATTEMSENFTDAKLSTQLFR